MKKLKELIADLSATGKDVSDLQARLDLLEGKKPTTQCVCQMDQKPS